jgi:uncharacterized protein with FMN-binding domain
LAQILKQSLLSSAVVVSFAAYAVHERLNGATDVLIAPTPVPTKVIAASVPTLTRTPTVTPRAAEPTLPRDTPTLIAPTRTPLPSPTAHPLANPLARGSYKDGEFVGTVADAYFGPLQVKAVIENGKLTDVQFLDYPKSRRTSQRINDRAMPVLKTEAVRAQNAQVDVVSGATLTSKAFMQSLQVALNKAK